MEAIPYHEARFWKPFKQDMIRCELCPKLCVIQEGKSGFCSIRKNIKGKLYNLGYGNPVGLGVDPIEKKPLFHFLPGQETLSFGTLGCNLGCTFCQNWHMSKEDEVEGFDPVAPETIVEMAIERGVPAISYTYNDPTIFFEYVVDIAKIAHKKGLKNILVTNGFIMPEPENEWSSLVDGVNVDLKAFTKEFFTKYTNSLLDPVLDTLRFYHKKKIWMELTNLKIPTLNDKESETKEMCRWIIDNIGPDHPLHFTAFHPDFKLGHLPPTPPKTLFKAREIAQEEGIHHVYCGNIHPGDENNTYCHKCGELLIRRGYMSVEENRLEDDTCRKCHTRLPGVF